MGKHLKYPMYIIALALSVAVAACATQYQPQIITQSTTGNRSQTADPYRDGATIPPTEEHRPPAFTANALQRGEAAYNRKDYGTALHEWGLLAQQGSALAQASLGALYANGQGVARDDAAAVRWYRLAAAQGEVLAQTNLGWRYANGQSVPRDDVEAVRWYRLAAAQGNGYAYGNLGMMYEQGRGVTRDLAEAQRWYAKAVELFPPALTSVWRRSRPAIASRVNSLPIRHRSRCRLPQQHLPYKVWAAKISH
jgi:TPR repeat protein